MKEFIFRPKKSNILLFILVGLLPLEVVINHSDSTETNFHINGGYGQFAVIERGCEGNVLSKKGIPFREVGVSVDHKANNPIRVGVNANYLSTKKRDYSENYDNYDQSYSVIWRPTEIIALNPFINTEWKYFAIGAGYVWSSRSLIDEDYNSNEHHFGSGYLRIGNLKSFYFDASFLHTPQLWSGSSFKLGLGFGANPDIKWWFGAGGWMPYDKGGFLAKTDIRIHSNLYLNTLIRLGGSEGVSESAINLGLTYKLSGDN